jgi:hypothetical protein
MGIKVQVTIESTGSEDDTIISAWFKSIECQEFTEWIEKVKSLEPYSSKKHYIKGFTGK